MLFFIKVSYYTYSLTGNVFVEILIFPVIFNIPVFCLISFVYTLVFFVLSEAPHFGLPLSRNFFVSNLSPGVTATRSGPESSRTKGWRDGFSPLHPLTVTRCASSIPFLSHYVSAPRLTYLLRSCPIFKESTILQNIDEIVRMTLTQAVNADVSGDAWTQATLPVRMVGLGFVWWDSETAFLTWLDHVFSPPCPPRPP